MAFGVYYPKTTEEVPPLVVGSDQPLVELGPPLVGLDCSHQPYVPSNWQLPLLSPLQLLALFGSDSPSRSRTGSRVHEPGFAAVSPSLAPAPTYTSALDAGGSTKSTILAKELLHRAVKLRPL